MGWWWTTLSERGTGTMPRQRTYYSRRNYDLPDDFPERLKGFHLTHDRNLNAALNLRNLLPPGRGPKLRNGKALTSASRAGETVRNDRRTAPTVPR